MLHDRVKKVGHLFHLAVLLYHFDNDPALKIVVNHTVGLFLSHRCLQYPIQRDLWQNCFDKRPSLLFCFSLDFRGQFPQFILLSREKRLSLFSSKFAAQVFFRKNSSIRLHSSFKIVIIRIINKLCRSCSISLFSPLWIMGNLNWQPCK